MVAGAGVILNASSPMCGAWAGKTQKAETAEAPQPSLSLCSFSPWYLQHGGLSSQVS